LIIISNTIDPSRILPKQKGVSSQKQNGSELRCQRHAAYFVPWPESLLQALVAFLSLTVHWLSVLF